MEPIQESQQPNKRKWDTRLLIQAYQTLGKLIQSDPELSFQWTDIDYSQGETGDVQYGHRENLGMLLLELHYKIREILDPDWKKKSSVYWREEFRVWQHELSGELQDPQEPS